MGRRLYPWQRQLVPEVVGVDEVDEVAIKLLHTDV